MRQSQSVAHPHAAILAAPETEVPAILVEVGRGIRIVFAARDAKLLPVPEVVPPRVPAIAVPGDAVNPRPSAALYNSTSSRPTVDEVSAATAPGYAAAAGVATSAATGRDHSSAAAATAAA